MRGSIVRKVLEVSAYLTIVSLTWQLLYLWDTREEEKDLDQMSVRYYAEMQKYEDNRDRKTLFPYVRKEYSNQKPKVRSARKTEGIKMQEKNEEKTEMTLDEWFNDFKRTGKRPNVLFLVADDMRPEIKAQLNNRSPWLQPNIVTPNLDRLAEKSFLFRRAYTQYPWCNPSRSSFLTSRRPDTTMVHNNSVFFRTVNPDFVTLPQYFKEHGYSTIGMGKIFHIMGLPHDHDDEYSWSKPVLRVCKECVLQDNGQTWQAVTQKDRQGKLLLDESVTRNAIKQLRKLAVDWRQKQQNFFLAVGMKKPHLNFQFPKHFMDSHYPLEKVSLPVNPKASQSLPRVAWFSSFEIRKREEFENVSKTWTMDNPLPETITQQLRRAYYSCVTYIDSLLGDILNELEDLRLANDTIVVFIGDHGFHLGEHSIFGKNTAFEVANNSPMIIRIPGVTDKGHKSDKLVEFVDIFPTLAELASLPSVPYCPPDWQDSRLVKLCTEGMSLIPLFRDPFMSNWKGEVFYQYSHFLGTQRVACMGYTIRTERYRYTEWIKYRYEGQTRGNWSDLCASELYDHQMDPHEMDNLADEPAMSEIKEDLSQSLRDGWTAALP